MWVFSLSSSFSLSLSLSPLLSKLIQLILLFLTRTEHGSDNHWYWNAFNTGTRKNTLEASNFVSLVESFYFVFIYLLFFFLSPSSSSFILHFSGKNEFAKIAALVVDQSENRTCLSITREPHAWAPQSTLRVRFFCAIVDAYHLIRTQFHL